MKSGAPAFGTPENLKLLLGTGQLERLIGLPWRSASVAASNVADMQAAQETGNALWGAAMGQATLVVHAAGSLEGGLTFGYEKSINDVEALQVIAEMCRPTPAATADLALDALAEVSPSGHFFAARTMERHEQAFHAPLVAICRTKAAGQPQARNHQPSAPPRSGKGHWPTRKPRLTPPPPQTVWPRLSNNGRQRAVPRRWISIPSAEPPESPDPGRACSWSFPPQTSSARSSSPRRHTRR